MFHPDFCEQTAGLPPSILAQAAARATRALSCSIPELGEINLDDQRAQTISDLLDKVVGSYQKKKMAAKARRTVVRAAARPAAVAEAQAQPAAVMPVPVVAEGPGPLSVSALAPRISQIVITAPAEPAPAPFGEHAPAPAPAPARAASSAAAPRPRRQPVPAAPEDSEESAEEEDSESEEESEEDEAQDDLVRMIARQHSTRPAPRAPAPPQKGGTAARWGL